MGIQALIIYFALCLLICIIVFMRIVCIMVFMWIVSFKIFIIMKRGVLRFVSMFFQYLKKGISKKTVPGILRFVSMLFLIFEKGDEQKNCARYFEICKYAF